MQLIHSLFEHSPIIALFVCVALGFAIGKIRIGQLQLGGIPGTLFAAILIGQIGVEVNEGVKTIAFALFIYSLGYVSGPQFFSSLGRSTLNQVHLSVFTSLVVFVTVWSVAQIFDLDKGTAAGLLAGRVRIGRRDLLGFRHVALNPYRHRGKSAGICARRRVRLTGVWIQKGSVRRRQGGCLLGRRITFLVWGEGFQWTGGGRNE